MACRSKVGRLTALLGIRHGEMVLGCWQRLC